MKQRKEQNLHDMKIKKNKDRNMNGGETEKELAVITKAALGRYQWEAAAIFHVPVYMCPHLPFFSSIAPSSFQQI